MAPGKVCFLCAFSRAPVVPCPRAAACSAGHWLLGFSASWLLGYLAFRLHSQFKPGGVCRFSLVYAAFGGSGFSHPRLSQFLSGSLFFGFTSPSLFESPWGGWGPQTFGLFAKI